MVRIKILFTGVVSLVIQFGLAIAGWRGWGAFFTHPAFQALLWVSVGLLVVAAFSEGGLTKGEKEDRSNRWVLGAFGLLALLGAYFSPYTDRVGFWTLDGDTMRWVGVVVCGAGGILRLWPVFVLGRRFSGLVAIQPGHTLETRGIFSLIRNPSYLGMMITAVGRALAFRSRLRLLMALSQMVPQVVRIRAEGCMLREHFGAEYEAYRAQTKWRLVPGIY